jgi:hypothetical protein
MKVVGGLFGKGATEAEETATADATEAAASRAESEGAGTRSQSQSEVECHSFTAGTRVLMADGTTKAIELVRVGDKIANSVPGAAGTEAHKVTAVIVTHTDHDFVDVAIRKTGESTGKRSAKSGAKAAVKSVAKKAARKAAFGLAASAAVLGALAGGHGHGDAHQPATAPVAAVSTVSSAQATQAGAQDAHLTTTFHHPFYDETESAFVEAKDLKPGDVLQTPSGTAEVTGVRLYHANTTTYDLTIGSLHTYYVEAGTNAVLVHNCNTAVQNELAQMRKEMGMDSVAKEDADVAAKVKGAKKNTLGKMVFDGDREPLYGQNGKLPRPVKFPGKGNRMTATSYEDHAEGDMVTQALDRGYSGGNAKIYTDRVTCRFCRNSMAGYAEQLDLDTLEVYDPLGHVGTYTRELGKFVKAPGR